MNSIISETLKKDSDEAVQLGNEFPGYMGVPPKSFSKQELIMLLNVLFNEFMETRRRELSLMRL